MPPRQGYIAFWPTDYSLGSPNARASPVPPRRGITSTSPVSVLLLRSLTESPSWKKSTTAACLQGSVKPAKSSDNQLVIDIMNISYATPHCVRGYPTTADVCGLRSPQAARDRAYSRLIECRMAVTCCRVLSIDVRQRRLVIGFLSKRRP